MTPKQTYPDLRRAYDDCYPRAARLVDELSRQLRTVIQDARIQLAFPIETRIKSWASLLTKRRRRGLRIRTIEDVNDLCGLRVVTLFRRDAERLAEAFALRFTVISEEDASTRLEEDRFGYSSIHLVVQVPDTWHAVPALSEFAGMKAEIQVRSTAQHLWAATSHALQYKTEASVPPPVLRAMSRLGALLELVDLELTRVVELRAGYRELLPTQVTTTLNTDSLQSVLDAVLPSANRDEDEFYHVLLEELLHFEIDTPLKLRSLLRKHMPRIMEEERETVEAIRHDGQASFESDERAMSAGVYFSHSGLARIAMAIEFGKAWTAYMETQSAYLFRHYPLPDEIEGVDPGPTGV